MSQKTKIVVKKIQNSFLSRRNTTQPQIPPKVFSDMATQMDQTEFLDFECQVTADPIEEEKYLLKCQRDKLKMDFTSQSLLTTQLKDEHTALKRIKILLEKKIQTLENDIYSLKSELSEEKRLNQMRRNRVNHTLGANREFLALQLESAVNSMMHTRIPVIVFPQEIDTLYVDTEHLVVSRVVRALQTQNQIQNGLEFDQIKQIPKLTYDKREFDENQTMQFFEKRCSICLKEYKDGQKVRQLNCRHFFHSKCIKPWMLNSTRCPNCNQDHVMT